MLCWHKKIVRCSGLYTPSSPCLAQTPELILFQMTRAPKRWTLSSIFSISDEENPWLPLMICLVAEAGIAQSISPARTGRNLMALRPMSLTRVSSYTHAALQALVLIVVRWVSWICIQAGSGSPAMTMLVKHGFLTGAMHNKDCRMAQTLHYGVPLFCTASLKLFWKSRSAAARKQLRSTADRHSCITENPAPLDRPESWFKIFIWFTTSQAIDIDSLTS